MGIAGILEPWPTPSLGKGHDMNPACQRRKLRLREAKGPAASPSITKLGSQDQNQVLSPKLLNFAKLSPNGDDDNTKYSFPFCKL